jgi:hypothetical protein
MYADPVMASAEFAFPKAFVAAVSDESVPVTE